jgi:hypothetical protein
MIQIVGWNCTSGLCSCEMKKNIFVTVVWSLWHRHFRSYRYCKLCEDWATENWQLNRRTRVYLPGMSVWWCLCSIGVNTDIFSDTTLTDAVSFCQCCEATLHLPSTVCFRRNVFFQQNAVPPHYHNLSNFLNDHFPGSSLVHWVKAKYPSLCPYLMFFRHLFVGNHIN